MCGCAGSMFIRAHPASKPIDKQTNSSRDTILRHRAESAIKGDDTTKQHQHAPSCTRSKQKSAADLLSFGARQQQAIGWCALQRREAGKNECGGCHVDKCTPTRARCVRMCTLGVATHNNLLIMGPCHHGSRRKMNTQLTHTQRQMNNCCECKAACY